MLQGQRTKRYTFHAEVLDGHASLGFLESTLVKLKQFETLSQNQGVFPNLVNACCVLWLGSLAVKFIIFGNQSDEFV